MISSSPDVVPKPLPIHVAALQLDGRAVDAVYAVDATRDERRDGARRQRVTADRVVEDLVALGKAMRDVLSGALVDEDDVVVRGDVGQVSVAAEEAEDAAVRAVRHVDLRRAEAERLRRVVGHTLAVGGRAEAVAGERDRAAGDVRDGRRLHVIERVERLVLCRDEADGLLIDDQDVAGDAAERQATDGRAARRLVVDDLVARDEVVRRAEQDRVLHRVDARRRARTAGAAAELRAQRDVVRVAAEHVVGAAEDEGVAAIIRRALRAREALDPAVDRARVRVVVAVVVLDRVARVQAVLVHVQRVVRRGVWMSEDARTSMKPPTVIDAPVPM